MYSSMLIQKTKTGWNPINTFLLKKKKPLFSQLVTDASGQNLTEHGALYEIIESNLNI